MLRHFAPLVYLRLISPLNSTIKPPPPKTMLDLLSLELASFLCNIEKGRGVALDVNKIRNGISEMLQLALDSVNCLKHCCPPLSESGI